MEPNNYYITLRMNQKELELEAEQMELRINMFEIESKRVYNSGNKHLYEPFRSKDIQTIMLSKLRRMINLQGLR